jgi:hypothetical protein
MGEGATSGAGSDPTYAVEFGAIAGRLQHTEQSRSNSRGYRAISRWLRESRVCKTRRWRRVSVLRMRSSHSGFAAYEQRWCVSAFSHPVAPVKADSRFLQ